MKQRILVGYSSRGGQHTTSTDDKSGTALFSALSSAVSDWVFENLLVQRSAATTTQHQGVPAKLYTHCKGPTNDDNCIFNTCEQPASVWVCVRVSGRHRSLDPSHLGLIGRVAISSSQSGGSCPSPLECTAVGCASSVC